MEDDIDEDGMIDVSLWLMCQRISATKDAIPLNSQYLGSNLEMWCTIGNVNAFIVACQVVK